MTLLRFVVFFVLQQDYVLVSPVKKKKIKDNLVVFVVDTSGSMCITSEMPKGLVDLLVHSLYSNETLKGVCNNSKLLSSFRVVHVQG